MSTKATTALLRFARRWFDERTVANVFEPLLADHQREWLDAVPAARLRITMRTATAFIAAMLTVTPRALFLTPTPASTTRRILARIIIFTSLVSALLTVPFLMDIRLPPDQTLWLFVWLLPSSIAVAFPFAMTWVADGIRRHTKPTAAERIAVFRTAMVAVAFLVIVPGWIIPATNQLFREGAAPPHLRPPARGVKELTTAQLLTSASVPTAVDIIEGRNRPRAVQRELNNRAVLALLPAVLLWVRWGTLSRRDRRWYSRSALAGTVTAIAVFFAFYFPSVVIERRLNLDAGVALWLPLVVLVMWGLAERRWAAREVAA